MTAKRKRDYRAEYARRKLRAQQRGFASTYQQRKYNEARKVQPFVGPLKPGKQTAYISRMYRSDKTLYAMREANKEFAPSLDYLSRTREERQFNSKWMKEKADRITLALRMQFYDVELGERDPAYVVAFFNAIVNPRTNYDSLIGEDGQRKTYRGRDGKTYLKMSKEQKDYMTRMWDLVENTPFMEPDEWDTRYGESLFNLS